MQANTVLKRPDSYCETGKTGPSTGGWKGKEERSKCVIYVANTSWYLYNFRLALMEKMVNDGWRVIAVAPRDRYSCRLEGRDIHYYSLPMSRKGANPIVDIVLLYRLYRLYVKEQPALVHHFTLKPVIYGTIAARMAGVASIVNALTGLGYVFSSKRAKARLLRSVISRAIRCIMDAENIRVIFQNPDDRDVFVSPDLLNPAHTVLIRGSGVDVDKFTPSPECEGHPVVLLCARMLRSKGVDELVVAARHLRELNIPGQIILAGESDPGNPEAIPEEQLRQWNEEGTVRWLGHKENMSEVYAYAHIVVLPSRDREGVPRTLIEAAACGRAIVATDVPGCREIVRHGENGLLVPAGNAEALSLALKTLMEDPYLRLQMGAKSREIAVSEFSQENVINSTLKVYAGLCGRILRDGDSF